MSTRQQRSTRLIHTAEGAAPGARPLTTPIYATSTFVFDSAASLQAHLDDPDDTGTYIYSRYANPTSVSLEAKLAVAEEAEAALAFGSGMGAVSTTLLGLLSAGDEVVCSGSIYGGTLHLLQGLLPRFGITATFVDHEASRDPAHAFTGRTRVFWFESPTNPTLRCVDIARVAEACRAAGVTSVIDNTFATPVNQQPLTLGIDLVMHSVTKYLSGHSDLTAGAVMGSRSLIDRLAPARKLLGTMLDPAAAYAASRGLKTLDVRMARHNANALAVADALQSVEGVAAVRYPGLPSHPDHAIAARQMRGFGGMVTVELAGGFEAATRAFDRLQVFQRAASLGGVESLCSLPALTSQYGWTDAQLERAGVTRGMLRLSVGLEDAGDLIDDLRQALTP
jgi:cystathionine beta-lyase/cystathionine gamma-synthase